MKLTKVSLRVAVGGMFLLATILTTLAAISLQYHFSKKMATEQALSTLSMSSAELSEYVQDLESEATRSAELLALIGRTFDMTSNEFDIRAILSKSMENNPLFYSIYIGTDSNHFYQVINLESSPIARQKMLAESSDRWVVVKITGDKSKRIRETYYYNNAFELRELKSTQSNYFPSQRPWFISAKADVVTKTQPYLFQHLKLTGQTYSLKFTPNSDKQVSYVLGIDIILSSLASKLSANKLNLDNNSNVESFIYLQSGGVVASNRKHVKMIAIPPSKRLDLSAAQEHVLSQTSSIKMSNQNDRIPIDFSASGYPDGYAVDVLLLIEDMTGIDFEFINGFSKSQLVEKYNNGSLDGLHSLQKLNGRAIKGSYSDPIYSLPFALATQDDNAYIRNYTELEGKKVAILSNWSMIPSLKQDFPNVELVEFETLKAAFESVSLGNTFALLDSGAVLDAGLAQYSYPNLQLHKAIGIGQQVDLSQFHIVLNHKYDELMPIINLAISNITAIQRSALQSKWMDNLHLVNGNVMIPYPELLTLAKLQHEHGKIIERTIDGEDKFIYIRPIKSGNDAVELFSVIIPKNAVYNSVTERVTIVVTITFGIMLLILPLVWIFVGPIVYPIHQLKLEAEKVKNREHELVQLIDTPIKEIWELSKSLTKMSSVLKQHERMQDEFLDALTKLIAQAIDDKSPYTAGHCNRVPELGMMLAEAAEQSDSKRFKDFRFANADEKREFKLAAWLHDCGKITTPEHIVDKGSKLEANYNRIHEIRTRFEVLFRDVEISALKQQIAIPANIVVIDIERQRKQQQLQDDFAFIAAANIGGEFMSDDKIARVKALSTQTWLRHFDNSLGLSPFEALAKTSSILPAVEQLLSDKPEHIIKREHNIELDPKHGIKMDIPEHQYNLGEVYNLIISRGTLTAEDRYKINEHIISTIKILDNLPFPPELSRVPRYASTHHETLTGTGYPRKLTAEDLSIPERILVIADIFEALTASDRPYKKAKPISIAIDIMYKMALNQHLDIELFKLFLQSGLHIKYARKYLRAEQLDNVDLSKYLTEK